MNKIYKVIYSKVRQCYVVVSEIAKSHGRHTHSSVAKSSSALTAAVLFALGAVSFTGMPVAQAGLGSNDYVSTNTDKEDGSSYAHNETKNHFGNGSQAVGSNTWGLQAQAGRYTTVIGDRNALNAEYSIYIGTKYDAINQQHPDSGKHVIAVGYYSDAAGTGSIAIGDGAGADTFDNAGSGKNADAGHHSIAFGYNAKAKNNNIAIGADSVATAAKSTTDALFTGQKASDVDSYISVGGIVTKTDPKTKEETSTTILRRITNVADGAADSDVATIAQLKDVAKAAGQGIHFYGVKDSSITSAVDGNNYNGGGATGEKP